MRHAIQLWIKTLGDIPNGPGAHIDAGGAIGRAHRSPAVRDLRTEARAALHDPPDTFTWWTDLVLLDQQDRTTMQLAVTLASKLNGVLRIRK